MSEIKMYFSKSLCLFVEGGGFLQTKYRMNLTIDHIINH